MSRHVESALRRSSGSEIPTGIQVGSWMPRKRKHQGFTLLELLVALTLFGLIATIAFGALRVGSRSWEAGLLKANETAELRAIPGFLRRHISQTLPLIWEAGGEKRIAFEGLADRVRFIAPAPQRDQGAGIYEFSLEVLTDQDGTQLVLYYEPFLPGEEAFRVSKMSPQLVLMEDLKAVTFSYYGSDRTQGQARWWDAWSDEAEQFPQVLLLRVETEDSDKAWAELNIPLRSSPDER